MKRQQAWIPGYEDDYAVTRSGAVISYKGRTPRILKQTLVCKYPTVSLCSGGHAVTRYVHRLMLRAFVGPCPDMHVAKHVNGQNEDNRLENLAWMHVHSRTPQLHPKHAKLTRIQVLAIKRRLADGETHASIAADYPVSRGHVSNISAGRTWGHIPTPDPSQRESLRKAANTTPVVVPFAQVAPPCEASKSESPETAISGPSMINTTTKQSPKANK